MMAAPDKWKPLINFDKLFEWMKKADKEKRKNEW